MQRVASFSPIIILSASARSSIEPFLYFHGCAAHVSAILSRDTAGGKSEKLKILQNKATSPVYCIVGDGFSDMEAAKLANIPATVVAWGWQVVDLLRHAGADFIADTPADIIHILNSL
ncbi:HAD family hydrolase [Phaeobacter inhibens]|uniref:HAD family hydrolase n=1 Tax=Phaeobacter inhibens TaxID=221822 RepID=UPI0021A5C5D3|nr:hypothetical protein [Phaeobacter inhibens]UWS09911.1 hypothetical protein K4K98_11140 [Phaeobacter inhibens]